MNNKLLYFLIISVVFAFSHTYGNAINYKNILKRQEGVFLIEDDEEPAPNDDEETNVVARTTTTDLPVTTSSVTPTETPEILEKDVKIGDTNAVVKAEVPKDAFSVPVILVI